MSTPDCAADSMRATPQKSGTAEFNARSGSAEERLKQDEAAPLFDEDGFLVDPSVWTRQTSQWIASMDGIRKLTSDHWAIILYLREHYLNYGTLPVMSHVCRVNKLKKNAVRQLFGGCRRAWRMAGLPNPGEEAKAYMD